MGNRATLILTVGLPRSGKSTWCRTQGRPTVCPDEVRRALGCFPFVAEMEPMVWFIVKVMVKALFASGACEVILDATNITKQRRAEWTSPLWTVKCVFFSTSKALCLARAEKEQAYLMPVIKQMHDRFDGFANWETVLDPARNLMSTYEAIIPVTP